MQSCSLPSLFNRNHWHPASGWYNCQWHVSKFSLQLSHAGAPIAVISLSPTHTHPLTHHSCQPQNVKLGISWQSAARYYGTVWNPVSTLNCTHQPEYRLSMYWLRILYLCSAECALASLCRSRWTRTASWYYLNKATAATATVQWRARGASTESFGGRSKWHTHMLVGASG